VVYANKFCVTALRLLTVEAPLRPPPVLNPRRAIMPQVLPCVCTWQKAETPVAMPRTDHSDRRRLPLVGTCQSLPTSIVVRIIALEALRWHEWLQQLQRRHCRHRPTVTATRGASRIASLDTKIDERLTSSSSYADDHTAYQSVSGSSTSLHRRTVSTLPIRPTETI